MARTPPPARTAIRRRLIGFTALLALVASLATPAQAASVTLRPVRDTAIYGDSDLSNGAGLYLFAGSAGAAIMSPQRRALRSLVAFDLSGQVPAGAVINSVTLTFGINTPLPNNTNTVRLHRVTSAWTEGRSLAGMGEGGGASAATGDATWFFRMYNTARWTTPGGDFVATPSASQSVTGDSGTVRYEGAGLVADVQAWVANPAANFGWILVAQNESGPAVRLASREGDPAPSLVIDFTAGGGGGGNVAPAIVTQPLNQTVTAGANVTFTASVSGTPAPSLQWQRNEANIPGATSASLTLSNVTTTDAGRYRLVATNTAGTVTSNVATLVVNAPSGGGGISSRLSNLSVRTTLATGQNLIVGFFVDGGARSILVRAVGPGLTALGVPGAMADPRLDLFPGGATTATFSNDNWPANLASVFTSVGAFALPPGSADAAFVQSLGGSASVHARGTAAGIVLVEAYDTGEGNTPRLTNVSARNRVGTGDDILIAGFNIAGTGSKNLLIRAVGPTLGSLGVPGVLADPKLDLFRAGTAAAIATNDNWQASLVTTFTSVGAFALTPNSADAALVTSLTPGSYTVQVSGVNNGTGEALVEIYELP